MDMNEKHHETAGAEGVPTAADDLLFQRRMEEQERENAEAADLLFQRLGIEGGKKAVEAAAIREEQDTRDWHAAGMGEAQDRKDEAMIRLHKADPQLAEDAGSGRCRPPFRDEAAHHSGMKPPTVPE